jgi:hypothetical protein
MHKIRVTPSFFGGITIEGKLTLPEVDPVWIKLTVERQTSLTIRTNDSTVDPATV